MVERRTDPNFYIDQTDEFNLLDFEDKIDVIQELFGDSREEAVDIVQRDRREELEQTMEFTLKYLDLCKEYNMNIGPDPEGGVAVEHPYHDIHRDEMMFNIVDILKKESEREV